MSALAFRGLDSDNATVRFPITILIALLMLPTSVAAQQPRRIPVTVVEVIDGDTLSVDLSDGQRERLRLIGIDAPEIVHPTRAPECFGRESMRQLSALAMGRAAELEIDAQPRDRFGRVLAYVWIDGALINERLASQGYAVPLILPPNVRYARQIHAGAAAARRYGLGLWSGCESVEPTLDIEPTVDDRPVEFFPPTAAPSAAPFDPTIYIGKGARGEFSCADFRSQAEGQAVLRADPTDPHGLDPDRNGIACETRPPPSDRAVVRRR